MSEGQSATSQGITPAVVVSPVATSVANPESVLSSSDVAAVRQLAIKANPNAVPELIRGNSVAEINASIEGAAAAYQRIADGVRGSQAGATAPPDPPTGGGAAAAVPVVPVIPAGGAVSVVDVSALPPTEMIKRGLEGRRAG